MHRFVKAFFKKKYSLFQTFFQNHLDKSDKIGYNIICSVREIVFPLLAVGFHKRRIRPVPNTLV